MLLIAFNSSGQVNFAIRRIDIVSIKCNGASNGQITITIAGGSRPYNYSINGGNNFQPLNSFTNLKAGNYKIRVRDSLGHTTRDSLITITQPAKLNVNISVGNLKCNGDSTGSLDISASGGTMPYRYIWSNGSEASHRSNLSAGTYMVTVSDSINCTVGDTVKITQPPILLATARGTNLSCTNNSGSVSVAASGGTVPYSYLWSNGSVNISQSGLSAGTYNVVVTDKNNCRSTGSVTLTRQDSVNKKYSIGDSTSCGFVFYVDPNIDSLQPCKNRYLVCAFTDQSAGIRWYNGAYLTTNATTNGLFNKPNADRIIRVQGDSVYAAIVCAKYLSPDSSCKGWYLPSRDELKLIYTNLAQKNIGNFANEGYWSSLEKRKNKAWIVDFFDGRNINVDKSNKYHIRAIRELIVE